MTAVAVFAGYARHYSPEISVGCIAVRFEMPERWQFSMEGAASITVGASAAGPEATVFPATFSVTELPVPSSQCNGVYPDVSGYIWRAPV